jgi:hypothetical protein
LERSENCDGDSQLFRKSRKQEKSSDFGQFFEGKLKAKSGEFFCPQKRKLKRKFELILKFLKSRKQ